MNTSPSFGAWLRQRRKVLDLTQFDLADQVGCSVVTIRKIEADDRRPSKQIAERLADVLAISFEERAEFIAFARHMDAAPSVPPLRSSVAVAHNLPPQPTVFIGRADELAHIAERLNDHECRLLTLVGAGGIGKTRLALQAAADQPAHFANGVYFVALTGVGAPNLVATAIGSALRMTFSGPDDPNAQLVNYLRHKTLLLVLDNFEHLLAATGLLSDMLAAAPGVKLLVTSRERLNLQEEWVIAVEGLTFPAENLTPQPPLHFVERGSHAERPDPPAEGSEVREYSAVQLFVQRARQIQANFSLEQNAEAVLSICRAVEGMPLGLELAASWLRGMSCAQIAQRIEGGLDFLATPLRNVPERHSSLRAVFEQSWRLLSGSEQTVLASLSVFRGGFDLEAAEQVAGASPQVLTRLVDKSLIRLDSSGRYDLHELLRQFTADKLVGSDVAEAVTRYHLDYFLRLAEQAEPYTDAFPDSIWFDRLEVEHYNFQAALGWSLTDGDATKGLRLAGALGWFWKNHFHRMEGRAWLEKALAFADNAPVSTRAKALHRTGELDFFLGNYTNAQIILEASLALAQQASDKVIIAWSLSSLGIVASRQNALERSVALHEGAVALFRQIENKSWLALALYRLGEPEIFRGNYGRAAAVLEESLALAYEYADYFSTPTLFRLGVTTYCQGDSNRAIALFQQALARLRKDQRKVRIFHTSTMLGAVTRSLGHYEQSRLFFEESLTLCLEINDVWDAAYCLAGLGGLAARQGQGMFATRLLGAASAHFAPSGSLYPPDRIAFDQDVAIVRDQLGNVAFATAWAEGQAMTQEQAIAYALEKPSDGP